MGNGQSRDEFAGILPSASTTNVLDEVASLKDPQPISEAWTTASSASAEKDGVQQPAAASVGNTPLLIGKITPPGHALQLEECTTSRSYEANPDKVDDRFIVPESVRKSQTMDKFANVCSEILSGFLYVSNFQVACDSTKLRALGIKQVINCCGELKNCADDSGNSNHSVKSGDGECQILKLLLRDDANEDLTPFLPQVVECISSCRQCGNKVLIHCHQGISRSCAFAIAYVMLEQRLSYHEAAALVKSQRTISSPNAAFICQLLEWEKDLQIFTSSDPIAVLGELYRLTPHSSYDPEYFVLKRCYDLSLGSARQRQNLATVRTHKDQQNLLWTQGTFVFQSPNTSNDIIIWQGAKCTIPEAITTAVKLATQLLRMQALARHTDAIPEEINFVRVQEDAGKKEHMGTDIDHFGYAVELLWSQSSAPKVSRLNPMMNGDASNLTGEIECRSSGHVKNQSTSGPTVPPKLFILEEIGGEEGESSWDHLTNYDSEDLTSDSVFILCSVQPQGLVEGYLWMGESCKFPVETLMLAALTHARRVVSLHCPTLNDNISIADQLKIERQNHESDKFWQLFEAGY